MKQPDKGRLIIDGVEIISTTCSWSDLKDKTIYLAGGGHQITIEFTDAGYMDKLRLAYSGPDTLRKPTMFPFESRDDILSKLGSHGCVASNNTHFTCSRTL